MCKSPLANVSDYKSTSCVKRKKIALMVSNICTLGGTERVTSVLSKELKDYYDCYILTLWNNGDVKFKIDPQIKIFSLYNKPIRLRFMLIDAVKRFGEYITREKINVLIVVGRNNGIIPLILKMLYKVKVIYCEHNSINSYKFSNMNTIQRFHRWILQKGIEIIPDEVVTLTKKDLEYYKKRGVKSTSIYNFIDDKLICENIDSYRENKRIITVARFDYQKGYEYLIEVAQKVFESHRDWQWHIYGSGDEEYINIIKEAINERGLNNNIIMMGTKNNIYDDYKLYDIYVMTSRFEGLPMVLLEAKSQGLPIVSFDIETGPSDIIRDGVDGYLVSPFNVEEMAIKIIFLIENFNVRKQMFCKARENLDKFRKEKIVRQWKDLIDYIFLDGGTTC